MNTETLTLLQKGEDFEIIVQHDQTGSAYGITLSKNAYQQLRKHFVVGRSEQLLKTQGDWLMANTSVEVEKIVDFVEHFKQLPPTTRY